MSIEDLSYGEAQETNIFSDAGCSRRLRAISEAAVAITSELSLDKVLQKIVDTARDLVNAKYAALGVVDENRLQLTAFLVSGLAQKEIGAIGAYPQGLGLLGLLLREPHPIRIRDMSLDPRSIGFPANHPPMRSFLGVPITVKGRILGNFYMADKIGQEEFSREDEDILSLFAAHAAVAIENARLYSKIDEQLDSQTSLLETVLDTMAEAVHVADPAGNLIAVNRSYMRLIGADSRDEAICSLKECSLLLDSRHENGQPMPYDELPMSRALRGETFTDALVLITPFGEATDRFVSVSGAPIRDEKGKVVGAVNVGRDVTEAKELERIKDDFISVASHEMKTPVAAAKGFAQLLAKRLQNAGDHPEEVELAGRVAKQIDRMAELLERLLDVSRIQTGRLSLYKENVDLGQLITELAQRMQVTSDRHLIRVDEVDPAIVSVDRTRIEQVLTNLLSNAVKYSPTGGEIGVVVTIVGDEVRVSVRDHGMGIAKEKQPHVFDRFFRATDHGGGMGLGLYVSRGIVESHGGKIWFESSEGNGSTFHFTLPL